MEMPGIEPGASYMQSMRSSTELHPLQILTKTHILLLLPLHSYCKDSINRIIKKWIWIYKSLGYKVTKCDNTPKEVSSQSTTCGKEPALRVLFFYAEPEMCQQGGLWLSCWFSPHSWKVSLSAGFEPARGDPNGFLVHRLNHSATTTHKKYKTKFQKNV